MAEHFPMDSSEVLFISVRWVRGYTRSAVVKVVVRDVETTFKSPWHALEEMYQKIYDHCIDAGVHDRTIIYRLKKAVHEPSEKQLVIAFYKWMTKIRVMRALKQEHIEVFVKPLVVTGYGSAGDPYTLIVMKDDKELMRYDQYVFDGLWAAALESSYVGTVSPYIRHIDPHIDTSSIKEGLAHVFEIAAKVGLK